MAAFCYFYHMTPTEYRHLLWKDFSVMADFMHDEMSRRSQSE